MQEPIAITLKPERVTVTAGGATAQVVAVIKNQTSVVDSYVLQVVDLDPDWYTLPTKHLSLFPDEQKSLSISFHPPADFETLDGRYDYALGVRSTVENGRAGQAPGALFVNLPEAINLRLKREGSRGQVGQHDLTVTNRSRSPQQITLSAETDDDLLDFVFDQSTIKVEPGGIAGVTLTIRLREGVNLPVARAFPFVVRAQTLDGREKSNAPTGQFQYTPAAINLEILPPRMRGVEGHYNLNVANPGSNPVPLVVAGSDPDEALTISFQIRSLVLQPGTSVILPFHVHLRAGRQPELRTYPFTISVRADGHGAPPGEIGAPAQGELVYEPSVDLGLVVERGQIEGTQGEYTVRLNNPSLVGMHLRLRAEDTAGALALFFSSAIEQLALPPGGALELPLLARLKLAPPARRTAYPFTLTVQATPDNGSAPFETQAPAELVCGTDGPILRLDLLPPQARGETGRFQVRVTSGVSNPLQVMFRGRDDDLALQYEFDPAHLQLSPEGIGQTALVVRPKNGSAKNGPHPYPFEIIAWSPGLGTDGATTRPGTWLYAPPPPPRLAMQLSPPRAAGQSGQFYVTLVNEGGAPLSVVLRGVDEAEALTFLFQVPRAQLQPREVQHISLIVQSRDGQPLPGPYRYPFELSGWVPGTMAASGTVLGELVVREKLKPPPILPPLQRLLVIALILGLMVGPFLNNFLLSLTPPRQELVDVINKYLPLASVPAIGAVVYGTSMQQMRGWRAALIALLVLAGALTFLLPLLFPGATLYGLPIATAANIFLIPALLIVLFA